MRSGDWRLGSGDSVRERGFDSALSVFWRCVTLELRELALVERVLRSGRLYSQSGKGE